MIKPAQSEDRSIYSYDWSYRTYQRFRNNYTRATDIINEIYNIDDASPAWWLSRGLPRWNNWKNTVKYFDFLARLRTPVAWHDPKLLNECIVELKIYVNKRFTEQLQLPFYLDTNL